MRGWGREGKRRVGRKERGEEKGDRRYDWFLVTKFIGCPWLGIHDTNLG
jgi:hypothetical protein